LGDKRYFWKRNQKKQHYFVGVFPTILQTILINSKKINKKIKHLKFIGCGSSILTKSLQNSFEKKFKTKVSNLYGMSEVGLSTFDNPYKQNRKLGSIGDPLVGVKIKLFNKKKKIIYRNNQAGEIGIKTPSIFSGYVGLNKKSIFVKNFFLTGDLAKKRNKIFFFIDRNKDIIIKGGVNIAPQEIDDCLNSHPAIKESATLGIPDKFFGENIKSFVVLLKNKKIDEDSIYSFCKKKLGFFKTPIKIKFLKRLPKTQSGKILKRLLK
jgi:Acyl-CoA synthetases (AMP-forming)/AMP-acid ligases II